MALQGSGAISISQIRTEMASTSYSLRTLSSAAGKSAPDSFSEFYGYSRCTAAGTFYTDTCSGCDYYYVYHNGSCGYYDTLIDSNSVYCGCGGGCTTISLACEPDPYLCCDTPCGYQENDDYNGLQSGIDCCSYGYYYCTAGAFSSDCYDCYIYAGYSGWGSAEAGSWYVGPGTGRCTGGAVGFYA